MRTEGRRRPPFILPCRHHSSSFLPSSSPQPLLLRSTLAVCVCVLLFLLPPRHTVPVVRGRGLVIRHAFVWLLFLRELPSPLSHTRLTRLLTRKEKGARGKMGKKEIFLKEDLSSSSFSDVLPTRERGCRVWADFRHISRTWLERTSDKFTMLVLLGESPPSPSPSSTSPPTHAPNAGGGGEDVDCLLAASRLPAPATRLSNGLFSFFPSPALCRTRKAKLSYSPKKGG